LMAGVVMGFLALNRDSGSWIQLVGSILLGGITYVASLCFFQRDLISDVIQVVRGALKKG